MFVYFIIDKHETNAIILKHSSAFGFVIEKPKENRSSGANPERNRHCKRGGSVQGESRSLGNREDCVHGLMRRKSGDLLGCVVLC